jgi:plasmid stability protein
MRTTLTLDEDVAAKLKAEARRSGRSFKETVNESLRRGLASAKRSGEAAAPFRVVTRDLGDLRPGLSLDNVADVLEQVEGPQHH